MTSPVRRSIRVSEDNLPELAKLLPVPQYSRSDLTASLVHIGVGGFHRAHQAMYLDDLLNRNVTHWAECGVGLLPQDARMKQALVPQQCLYTVLTRSREAIHARVVGSIVRYLHALDGPESVLNQMADAATRIVSLTVTEGGYYIDEGSGQFQADHPTIRHDLESPAQPLGVLGYLAEALDRRRRLHHAPFTVLSCDNLPGNGHAIRRSLLSFAELRDPELRAWIEQNVAFPSSMVDGITPVTTESDRLALREIFGVEDAWPVVTEPFRQWVVEDSFSNGRPPWEEAGVQFTSDVSAYELMKLRLLNAGHSALGYLGARRGFRYVHEAAEDPVFRSFLESFFNQVVPLIPPLPGIDLDGYRITLLQRFSNSAIGDQLSRICSEGSSKLPKFVLASIRDLAQTGRPHSCLSLVIAAWFLYLQGRDENGNSFEVLDAHKDELSKISCGSPDDPSSFLQVSYVFGDLSENAGFVEEVAGFVRRLRTEGVEEVVRSTR